MVGGIRVNEPAADLPVLTALFSSYRNRSVSAGTVIIGEVGLTGEVRLVPAMERRISDAAKLGFGKFVVPDAKLRLPAEFKGKIIRVRTVEEAIDAVFE